jgi:hypothetical protein
VLQNTELRETFGSREKEWKKEQVADGTA